MTRISVAEALQKVLSDYNNGQAYTARLMCIHILRSFPDQVDALYLQGMCLFKEGDPVAALEKIKMASDLAPGRLDIAGHLKAVAKAAEQVVLRNLERNTVQEAVTSARAIIAADPDNATARRVLDAHDQAALVDPDDDDGALSFCIGITTFDKRFDDYLVPLVRSIKEFLPMVRVLVCVNGNHKAPFDEIYRKRLLEFCAAHKHVFPIVFPSFRGLSKMWNNLMIFAPKDYVLLLNDDVGISDRQGLLTVEQLIRECRTSFKINSCFSHVVLKRSEIDELGYFDERLLGIGGEDLDMLWRYEQCYGRPFDNARINAFISYVSKTAQSNVKTQDIKYSVFNSRFIEQKYVEDLSSPIQGPFSNPVRQAVSTDTQYTYERFYHANRDKI